MKFFTFFLSLLLLASIAGCNSSKHSRTGGNAGVLVNVANVGTNIKLPDSTKKVAPPPPPPKAVDPDNLK